jgi:hypothetical protein
MTDQLARQFDDERLAAALGELAGAIEWPPATIGGGPGPDLASRVRVRLVGSPPPRATRSWFPGRPWRPARLALVLALVALLAVAVAAGAAILGLPGLRLTLAPPSSPLPTLVPSRSPTPGEPGSSLGLGALTTLDEVETVAGRPIGLPTDPAVGQPDAAYVDRSRANQVAFVWAASDTLTESLEPGVGLILHSFDGATENEYFEKLIHTGTTIEPVTVDGNSGYWIEGAPHFFFYTREDGRIIDDDQRWVGDALVWTDGVTTYRLETALGRDAAIRIAESVE